MFNELRRSGQMEAHLRQKQEEVKRLMSDLLPENPTLAQEREAEEIVRAQVIEFPSEYLKDTGAGPKLPRL